MNSGQIAVLVLAAIAAAVSVTVGIVAYRDAMKRDRK